MKRHRIPSENKQSKCARKSKEKEETLFDLLPHDLVKIEILMRLEPPWRYNLGKVLNIPDLVIDMDDIRKNSTYEVVKYGLGITKYMNDLKLIIPSYVSRVACYYGDWDTYRYGLTLLKMGGKGLAGSHCNYAIVGGRKDMVREFIKEVRSQKVDDNIKYAIVYNRIDMLDIIYEMNNIKYKHLTMACELASVDAVRYYKNELDLKPKEENVKMAFCGKAGENPIKNMYLELPAELQDNSEEYVIAKVRNFINEVTNEFGLTLGSSVYDYAHSYSMFKLAYELGHTSRPSRDLLEKVLSCHSGRSEFIKWLLFRWTFDDNVKSLLLMKSADDDNIEAIKDLRDRGTPWSILSTRPCTLMKLMDMGYPFAQESITSWGKYQCFTSDGMSELYPLYKKIGCNVPNAMKIDLLIRYNTIPEAASYIKMMNYTSEFLVIPLCTNNTQALIDLYKGQRFNRPKETLNLIIASLKYKKLHGQEYRVTSTGVESMDKFITFLNVHVDKEDVVLVDNNSADPSIKQIMIWSEDRVRTDGQYYLRECELKNNILRYKAIDI